MEPAFVAANEEALLAAGYVRGKGSFQNSDGDRGGSWKRGNPGEGYIGSTWNQRPESGKSVISKNSVKKNTNPTGPDDHLLTCKSCGSFRHLLPACLDSWENLSKTDVVADENALFFTGYNKEEVRRLGIDARNCVVLDRACSSAVCGENWLNSYIQSLDRADKMKVQHSIGESVFKFGGGTR